MIADGQGYLFDLFLEGTSKISKGLCPHRRCNRLIGDGFSITDELVCCCRGCFNKVKKIKKYNCFVCETCPVIEDYGRKQK
jgi:hypothetical protein